MNKPQLSLALSLSVALQASMLSAQSAPQGAIWQRMSGSPSSAGAGVSKAAQRVSATKTVAKAAKPAAQQVDTIDSAHAMLFLKGKDAGVAPAAALTIHPTLPLDEVAAMPIGASAPSVDVMQAPAVAARESVQPARQMAALPSSALTTASSKQLVAQLAPDHVIAQADHSTLTTQPIPPVVTGALDFEEYKVTNILDLKVSQSRTFKLKNKIVRTSISDPGIAEPVVVSENQLVLLGKAPGTTTMVLWDDAGNSVALDLRVSRDYSQLQATLREIDPRVIVKTFSVGGSDRVLLTGDVDHPESIIKAFAASNVFMDDRGMNIQVANSRIVAGRIGEQGGTASGGGQTGQLSSIGSVDKYTYFGNIPNNIGKAQVMVSDGGRVTSLVKVRKVPLIVLHVTFLEMNTSAARELALNAGFGFSSNSFAFGVGGSAAPNVGNTPFLAAPGMKQNIAVGAVPPQASYNNTAGVVFIPGTGTAPPSNTMGAALQPVTFLSTAGVTAIGQNITYAPTSLLSSANLLGSPGGVTFDSATLGNLFTGVTNMGGPMGHFSVNPTIQGIIGARRARVLAEPTLVTLSGERASFLAGGEIPIQQAIAAAGAAQQSIVFEPFGMRINMIPVLQENGTINLEVSPEERLIANELSLTTIGAFGRVPGFTTRKTQTIVELKPGQELYISGLVSANVGREITKMPILGEVPVLGALYRSKAFNKNESELVVSVRPEIILPGTPGQLKLPEEIGRVEGPRDLNVFAVEPTVMDERYYSSGRSERHQKTSPTLPEGAPVPDNE